MSSAALRFLLILGLSGLPASRAFSQMTPAPALSGTEPGLEKAVKWKWKAVPSDPRDWGLEIPVLERPIPAANPSSAQTPVANNPNSYEVKRGDALIRIAKQFGVTVEQLKIFNGLTKDTIIVGQILKIPTLSEASAIAPGPNPPKSTSPSVSNAQMPEARRDLVMLQVFLDREHFSTGPIDGVADPTFQKILQLYQSVHEGLKDSAMLMARARSVVGDPFTTYTLKPEDFRFIAPPKPEMAVPPSSAAGPSAAKKKPVASATPPPTYDQLTAAPMLAYRSPWEFVAERFHCDEAFLRSLNERIKTAPLAGTEFRVPNVIPFEIEKPLENPIQPPPDPAAPVSAAVLDLSLVAIYRNDVLIAAMPMAVARPGLRGKDSWTIFEAIPHPRLVTRQEPTEPPRPVSTLFTGANPSPTPTPAAPAVVPETQLAAGPNNPAGVLWIKLAKASSPEPPPYGLHGTSIPDQMKMQSSIGWLRLTNWDIVRAARLLPVGTPLAWKGPASAAPAPVAVPVPVSGTDPITTPPPADL